MPRSRRQWYWMVTTETPPVRQSELHDVPVLVIQLRDELARSRLREAFWISVIVHLVLILAVLTSPRWITFARPIPVRTADELMRGKELTFLQMPQDLQKVDKRPDTNIISDKNRIATSRRPTLDRHTLDELHDSVVARAPAGGAPAQPSTAPAAPAAMPPQMRAQSGPDAAGSQAPSMQARLQPPAAAEQSAAKSSAPFSAAVSPGSAIAQAARAAASGHGGYGGTGDYAGVPMRGTQGTQSNLDILSDTMGVDFGPYLSRVIHDVRQNWYVLIPEVARAPLMKKGKVSIEFAILKDGRVAGMRTTAPSGDISLDRAAWGGITNSDPFPPLPSEFRGSYLALRFHFYYNPDRGDLR